MFRNNIFLITLLLVLSERTFAVNCSTILADCFKKTITNLEAGDPRLKVYVMKTKVFLKDFNKNAKKGLTFNNNSVLLKNWILIERIENQGKNVVVLQNPTGKKYALAWSETQSFTPDISKSCANNEPTEFLTGEVYTHKDISSAIVVVDECGIDKLINAAK
jgi:hypothetical protein